MNPHNWNNFYTELVERNIGLVSFDDQEKMRTSHIAICGVGGIGGRIAEMLVRLGCEHLTILDQDKYTMNNLSTQIITQDHIGKYKVDVLSEFFEKINPNVKIRKFYEIKEDNIDSVLASVSIASLSLDGPIASILISRTCKKNDIPMVEAWSMPYLYAWWFTQESLDYESCYGLTTQTKSIQELRNDRQIITVIRNHVFTNLFEKFPEVKSHYNKKVGTFSDMKQGKISLRSLAPFVALTAGYLAFEIVFSGILKQKPMILAPNIIGFDLFTSHSFQLDLESVGN